MSILEAWTSGRPSTMRDPGPVPKGPPRAERRAMRRNFRALMRRAAKARDGCAKLAGTGTPEGDIRDWIRTTGWSDGDKCK